MKRYSIEHLTTYRYQGEVSDSFGHLRLFPRNTPFQKVISHSVEVTPTTDLQQYEDYFGNQVRFFSVPQRHHSLQVRAQSEVVVSPPQIPIPVLDVSIAEARQIYHSRRYEYYDFLRPTPTVQVGAVFQSYLKKQLPSAASLKEALLQFNRFIHTEFQYQTGKTNVSTTAAQVAQLKKGVCQDFTHFMLGVLRTAQIPARYVSGYIETDSPQNKQVSPTLIGSAATHAWVEVLLPGDYWWGLDPTNDLEVTDRHIVIASGRDYHDLPPLRGTYRGAPVQSLEVKVQVQRNQESL